jgi:hypothetical protein
LPRASANATPNLQAFVTFVTAVILEENRSVDVAQLDAEPSIGIVADIRPSWLRWRRDYGDETLAEIGRSYNVSGWTILRLTT